MTTVVDILFLSLTGHSSVAVSTVQQTCVPKATATDFLVAASLELLLHRLKEFTGDKGLM